MFIVCSMWGVEENKHLERVDTYRYNIYIEWTVEANGIKRKNEKKFTNKRRLWDNVALTLLKPSGQGLTTNIIYKFNTQYPMWHYYSLLISTLKYMTNRGVFL